MTQYGPKPISEAERRLGELLESAPDAIIEFDGQGSIVLLNRMAQQLFGYTREELLGQMVEMLIPEALGEVHEAHRADYMNNPVTRPMGSGLKLDARRKDGSHFPVEISLSPVKSESGYRVTAIIRDITERTAMEERLQSIQKAYVQQLEERNREVEQANQLKSEFLGNMSHELRSPLQTIIGFTELLGEEIEGPLNDKQKRSLSNILNDSLHLLSLINDLLDLTKVEAGRLELQQEAFPIGAVWEEVLTSVRPRASAKRLVLEAEIAIRPSLFADRLRFKQILHNLMSNAIKFTPPGGMIRVHGSVRGGFAEISVSDTGIGIPEDSQQAVFDKFY